MEQQQWPDICRLQGNGDTIGPRPDGRHSSGRLSLVCPSSFSSSPESARCLQHLCRLQIRRCLGRLRLRSPVFMSFLPLPGRLKDYILYREFDLYGQQAGWRSSEETKLKKVTFKVPFPVFHNRVKYSSSNYNMSQKLLERFNLTYFHCSNKQSGRWQMQKMLLNNWSVVEANIHDVSWSEGTHGQSLL